MEALSLRRRINQATYICQLAVCIATLLLMYWLTVTLQQSGDENATAGLVVYLGMLIPLSFLVIITKQRANDVSLQFRVAIWLAALFIPFGIIAIGLMPTEPGPNRLGPEPQAGVHWR